MTALVLTLVAIVEAVHGAFRRARAWRRQRTYERRVRAWRRKVDDERRRR